MVNRLKHTNKDIAKLPPLLRQILTGRGIVDDDEILAFINPSYEDTDYDPFLLPDMDKAVDRLLLAAKRGEQVTIYSDYDVDGTTGAAVLLDALPRFNIKINYYVPDRFKEGYGLNVSAIDYLKQNGTDVILTVDNGIVSFDEVDYANKHGIDVIVTDHHTPREKLPNAIAVVNPKILARDHPSEYDGTFKLKSKAKANQLYPFLDICGCGVAFKLVRALQGRWPGMLPMGQEKWLLDLVALATVSDIVSLVDENRALVYWGLEVIKKTRRLGLKALMAVAGIEQSAVDSRTIGFVLGPRINAAGRLAHASLAIELLSATSSDRALELATQLNDLNNQRKQLQTSIYDQAIKQVDYKEPVAVAVGENWHEGVIGIVASKIQEAVEKPTFVFSLAGDEAKASGRSFGDFSVAAAINATSTLLVKGGGHAAAGGVTVARTELPSWIKAVNDYYRSLRLTNQAEYLYPRPELEISSLDELTVDLVNSFELLEPFGAANPVPVVLLKDVIIFNRRLMGSELNHVRYTFMDDDDARFQAVAFGMADRFTLASGEFGEVVRANVLVELSLNEWNGEVSVQGKLLRMDKS